MSSKAILAGVIATAIVGTAPAAPVVDKVVTEKKAQATIISGVIHNMVQTINSPECTVHPYLTSKTA